jgi:hypothetical protein
MALMCNPMEQAGRQMEWKRLFPLRVYVERQG